MASAHINDIPNEILSEILKLALPSFPSSLAAGMRAPASLSTCHRWRALVFSHLQETSFIVIYPSWNMKITGYWAPIVTSLGQEQDTFKLPKLILQIDAQKVDRFSMLIPTFRRSPPPYQVAFLAKEELEIWFTASFKDFENAHLRSVVNSPLRYLQIKGEDKSINLLKDLHPQMFPHLTQLFMEKCSIAPDDFAAILRGLPDLKECRTALWGDGWGETVRKFESTSLVSLSIHFMYFKSCDWPAIIDFPNLENLTCIAHHPFRNALRLVNPSIRTIYFRIPGSRCDDRQGDLITVLEKCPQLERLVIPTELMLFTPFFDKISSGAIVPNLKELQCGPSLVSSDKLVGFLRKKGFVDAPREAADLTAPAGVCAFDHITFCAISLTTRKEIEERLEGVTNAVEFAPHEKGTSKPRLQTIMSM